MSFVWMVLKASGEVPDEPEFSVRIYPYLPKYVVILVVIVVVMLDVQEMRWFEDRSLLDAKMELTILLVPMKQ